MISQAATALIRRGNILSLRRTQISTSHHSFRGVGGVHLRLLTSSSTKTPPSSSIRSNPTATVSKTKDARDAALEKSQRLHAELKEMIEAQKARDAEELQKPFGSNIIAFLKTSKPEIVNIFFAFVCVLLAYQIHAMRAGIKKLLAEREEKDAEIDKLRNILANLSEGIIQNDEGLNNNSSGDNSFSARLAQKCANVVRDMFEQSEKKVGYSWILGKKLASGDSLEFEKLIEKLHPMILSSIQTAVGDAQFTPEELKERRVAALQGEQHGTTLEDPSILDDGGQPVNGSSTRKNDAQMGDLMQVLEEVHNQDLTDGQNIGNSDEDGSTKVRRTRYAI